MVENTINERLLHFRKNLSKCVNVTTKQYTNKELILSYTPIKKRIGFITYGKAFIIKTDIDGNTIIMRELKENDIIIAPDRENILEKLTSAAKSVSHTLVCKKPVGRILKVENNSQYHINLGKINNIKQGNRFLIEHSNNFNDKNGIRRFQKNQAKTPMVVTDVYNNTAVLKPITQSNGNVQINDHAYIE